MIPRHKKSNERGAVLLTTLLLMTVMAAITVAIVDDIRLSIKRTMSIQAAEQLDWYMRGGEEFAGNWLQPNLSAERQPILSSYVKSGQAVVLPIEGGEISFSVRDGRNCYNLNQLSEPKTARITRAKFIKLLQLLEFDDFEAETIAASVQDWIDRDTAPTRGGAEDLTYTNLNPPYHPANTLMTDITELRAVQGITEDVYQRLTPFVCARQNEKAGKVNLNTLLPEQAPLLALEFGADDSLRAAQAVIAQRPVTGYEDIDTVWALEPVADLDLKGAGKDMVSLITDQVVVDIRVSFDGQVRAQSVLFSADGTVGAELISRRALP